MEAPRQFHLLLRRIHKQMTNPHHLLQVLLLLKRWWVNKRSKSCFVANCYHRQMLTRYFKHVTMTSVRVLNERCTLFLLKEAQLLSIWTFADLKGKSVFSYLKGLKGCCNKFQLPSSSPRLRFYALSIFFPLALLFLRNLRDYLPSNRLSCRGASGVVAEFCGA